MKKNGFKLVLLGESGTGKTSIINRFIRSEFLEVFQEPTKRANCLNQTINYDKENYVDFEIWDTGGREEYRSIAPMYYKGADVCFVTYDVTEYETYNAAKGWVKELKRECVNENIVIILIGNKRDLAENKGLVKSEEAKMYSEDNDILFYETSAKSGENVHLVFEKAGMKVLKLEEASMFDGLFVKRRKRRKSKKQLKKEKLKEIREESNRMKSSRSSGSIRGIFSGSFRGKLNKRFSVSLGESSYGNRSFPSSPIRVTEDDDSRYTSRFQSNNNRIDVEEVEEVPENETVIIVTSDGSSQSAPVSPTKRIKKKEQNHKPPVSPLTKWKMSLEDKARIKEEKWKQKEERKTQRKIDKEIEGLSKAFLQMYELERKAERQRLAKEESDLRGGVFGSVFDISIGDVTDYLKDDVKPSSKSSQCSEEENQKDLDDFERRK